MTTFLIGGEDGCTTRPSPVGQADAWAAGMSGVHTGEDEHQEHAIEALERAFPMRVRVTRLGTGTAVRASTPEATRRARLEMLEDVTVSLITGDVSRSPGGSPAVGRATGGGLVAPGR